MPPPLRTDRHSMPPPEDYFKGVSPMCRRILDEMSSVRESYGEKWKGLSYEEQCKVLDQAIVDEATVRRYEIVTTPSLDCQYFPKLKISTGQKIISDEKLSARGYTCSWRDEHSAPFSWHTRSQMDLTLETPPVTPTQIATSPQTTREASNPLPQEGMRNAASKTQDSISSITLAQTPKTSPFLWHYEPNRDIKAPEPPDLVIGTPVHCMTSPQSESLIRRGSHFNHVVVTTDERGSIYNWFRGAFNFFAGSCFPMHACAIEKGPLLHPSSPFIHPELRPPHVIAKAAKVAIPTMNQPKKEQKPEKPPALNKEKKCPAVKIPMRQISTANKVPDAIKDSGRCPGLIDDQVDKAHNESLFTVNLDKKSLLDSSNSYQDKIRHETVNKTPRKIDEAIIKQKSMAVAEGATRPQKVYKPTEREKAIRVEEELPLISMPTNHEDAIPKTGFDFLDNW